MGLTWPGEDGCAQGTSVDIRLALRELLRRVLIYSRDMLTLKFSRRMDPREPKLTDLPVPVASACHHRVVHAPA